MMQTTVQKFKCTATFDPCFGLSIHRKGDVITTQLWPDENRFRVIQDNRGQTMGFGWVITKGDLNNHFTKVEG